MSSCKILQWCQKVFHEKKQQQRTSKASSSFCSKQTIQIFVHFSVTQIHHIIFFQALLLLFFTFSVFSKKKKSLLALSLATSFFFPLLFLLPRIQLPLNMVLLYCFLSFFFFLGKKCWHKSGKGWSRKWCYWYTCYYFYLAALDICLSEKNCTSLVPWDCRVSKWKIVTKNSCPSMFWLGRTKIDWQYT